LPPGDLPTGEAGAILVTRPEPGAHRTAARLAEQGFSPILAPCLTIRALPARLPAPERIQAVLITSANAATALSHAWHNHPIFTVGTATAASAREAGCTNVHDADANAEALATLVATTLKPRAGALLLLSGRSQGHSLATSLRAQDFRVERRVVYAAAPPPTLPAPAIAALRAGKIRAALFFSAKTARVFLNLASRAGTSEYLRQVEAIGISEPTRMALETARWRRIRVASRPTQDAMLACLR